MPMKLKRRKCVTSKAAIVWLGLVVVVNAFGYCSSAHDGESYTAGAAQFQDRAKCPKGPDLGAVPKSSSHRKLSVAVLTRASREHQQGIKRASREHQE